jgi:D-alanyl-lipoteichoic acid acyltransferase DltB (MBOAT superfamily)
MYSGFENLFALFAYSLQVYADFSGYTDIAIGVAMMMGFYLPKNFNSPYKATNPGDFWKRWHISLSTWLKDYLYIPMGGNRNATFASYSIIVIIGVIAVILSGNIWVGVGLCLATAGIVYLFYAFPNSKKKINTNINLMNTMLVGGLWHGASWNFVIWGGLNGIGIVFHKFWKKWTQRVQLYFLSILTALFVTLSIVFSLPVLNIAAVWLSIIFAGFVIPILYSYLSRLSKRISISLKFSKSSDFLNSLSSPDHLFQLILSLRVRNNKTNDGVETGRDPSLRIASFLSTPWAILQTFVFISFTRLFFRSGSNLNPEEANSTAWNTAKNMLNQIGASWNISQIGSIIYEYRHLFLLIIFGMLIHWLPENLKRRYRLLFASMPLPVMAAFAIAIVFIIYQFVTADLQAFIYFQF